MKSGDCYHSGAAGESSVVTFQYMERSVTVLRRLVAGVRQRRWSVYFRLDGKQVMKGLETEDEAEALKRAKGVVSDAVRGLWEPGRRRAVIASGDSRVDGRTVATVGEVAEVFERGACKVQVTLEPGTRDGYLRAWRNLARWVTGAKSGADVDGVRVSRLTPESAVDARARYVSAAKGRIERDVRLRGWVRMVGIARAVVGRRYMVLYKGMEGLDLEAFWQAATVRVEHKPKLAVPVERLRGMVAMARGWRVDPAMRELWKVHLMFRQLGLRNDEIIHARVKWAVRRDEVLVLPDGERVESAGVLRVVQWPEWEPKRSEGVVGISPDVWEELLAGRVDAEGFIVAPGLGVTERDELVNRVHSAAVREWVAMPGQRETSYALRGIASDMVLDRQGPAAADAFLRHAGRSVRERHYSRAHEKLVAAPLGLGVWEEL